MPPLSYYIVNEFKEDKRLLLSKLSAEAKEMERIGGEQGGRDPKMEVLSDPKKAMRTLTFSAKKIDIKKPRPTSLLSNKKPRAHKKSTERTIISTK